MRPRALLLLAVAAACGSSSTNEGEVAESTAPVFTLDSGGVEFPVAFSAIVGLVELPDGRVLLYDQEERAIRAGDFTTGVLTRVAARGSGPLEFQGGSFLQGVSDTAVFFDASLRRFLLFTPTGEPARTVPFGAADLVTMMTQFIPIGVDAKGNVYGQASGMRIPGMGGGGLPSLSFADTVTIQRQALGSTATDTVAMVRNEVAQSQPKVDMSGGTVKASISAPSMRAGDVWTALPDGRVAILRDGDYRVQFVTTDGRAEYGPQLPYERRPFTETDRAALMDSIRVAMETARQGAARAMGEVRARAGGAGGSPMPTGIDFEVNEPVMWATHWPPYVAITVAPDGRIWVTRPTPTGEPGARFDVLDDAGVLVAHVRLAPRERLLALGRGQLYTLRVDADDLQYVRRYPLSAPAAR